MFLDLYLKAELCKQLFLKRQTMKEFLKINQVPIAGNLKNVSKLKIELRASEIRYRLFLT